MRIHSQRELERGATHLADYVEIANVAGGECLAAMCQFGGLERRRNGFAITAMSKVFSCETVAALEHHGLCTFDARAGLMGRATSTPLGHRIWQIHQQMRADRRRRPQSGHRKP